MSAPDTNVKKQERRHKVPLWGMSIGLAFAAVLLILYFVYLFAAGQEPGEADVQIDGRTGEPVVNEETVTPTE